MTDTRTPTTTTATFTPPPSGTHHGRRIALVIGVVVALIVGLFYIGGGWYFSGRIESGGLVYSPSTGVPSYNLTITALPTGADTLQATGDAPLALTQPSYYALMWAGGSGHVGPPTATGSTVTRPLTDIVGAPPTVGTPAALERDWYLGNPTTSLGLPFTEENVNGPLGPLPAWYVPASGTTVAVMVHGRGGIRREMLRALTLVHDAGMPALVITYRGDIRTAPDPSGYNGYGASEWPDLQAAVDWATAHGAQHVLLVGNSMGGSIVAAFLQHSDRANIVTGVLLDSAMLDFSETVYLGASQTALPVVGLPVPTSLTWVAERIAGWRFDIDWTALDYVSDTSWVKAPMLVVHGPSDPTVPVSVSRDFAAANPTLVAYEEFPNAAHLESWNTDRTRYSSVVSAFLTRIAQG